MVRRGCLLILAFFAAFFAVYFAFFTRYFEWPGNAIAAGFGSLFGAMGLGAIGNLLWAWRDTAAFARAERGQAPSDGRLAVAAGPIRPLGAPLTSPIGGESCVAYEYEVFWRRSRRGETSKACDLVGFGMTASAVETPRGNVRLLGFPMLDEFVQSSSAGPAAVSRAQQYAATAPFQHMQGLAKLNLFAELDDALSDADGVVRKDFRLTEGEIPIEHRTLGERVVKAGQQVCALGLYDASKQALVPRGATLNRLWPGTAAEVRQKIVGVARSQAKVGLVFFVVSHAMLGLAFYLSETRHAREPESEQATAIRLAVQDDDVQALERAVRRGANPNARDGFGHVVLLDVREPAMAAALIRLGADPNVQDPDSGDTLLIRAARMGHLPLVQALLAARASVLVRNAAGATALDEAVGGGHAEIAALLRAAAADVVPLEK